MDLEALEIKMNYVISIVLALSNAHIVDCRVWKDLAVAHQLVDKSNKQNYTKEYTQCLKQSDISRVERRMK